ncbi:hypothetical protein V9Y75_27155 [Klebsiella pneumoniae]|uniref:hypothetical protein n=1 Tax=Enterobacterales TaxID=91347 RepID=UPI00312F9A1B
MSYMHVIIDMKKVGKESAVHHVETNLTNENEVLEDFITPYLSDDRVIIDGSNLKASDIEKISVFKSDKTAEELFAEEERKVAQSGIIGLFARMPSAIRSKAENITREMFKKAQKT